MQVVILDDGRLQLFDEGQYFAPLTMAEVEALANAMPAAQVANDYVNMTDLLKRIAYALANTASGNPDASMTVYNFEITMTASPDTFAALQTEFRIGGDADEFTFEQLTATRVIGA